jgi:hypothetical protein
MAKKQAKKRKITNTGASVRPQLHKLAIRHQLQNELRQ